MMASLDALLEGPARERSPSSDSDSDDDSSDSSLDEERLESTQVASKALESVVSSAELHNESVEFSKSIGRDILPARTPPVHVAGGMPSALLPAGYRPQPSDFQLVRVVGRGAYGKVLLVTHTLTGRPYAMKAMEKASLAAGKSCRSRSL
jgi:hypothetical protein